MNPTLVSIQKHLEAVIAQVKAAVPNDEPFGTAHGNWSFPGLTKPELIEEAQAIVDFIKENPVDNLGAHEARIKDYVRRLQHLQQQTVANIWQNAGQAVPAYLFTLRGLRKAIEPVLVRDTRAEAAEAAAKLRKLANQLRGMESQLNGLSPRTASLVSMVERIEQAHNAADQLPTDLETLGEARNQIAELVRQAVEDRKYVADLRVKADGLDAQLRQSDVDAKSVLERCETAYSAATSVGLAAAFGERSEALSISMRFWVGGLIVSLVAGTLFGTSQISSLSTLFRDPAAPISALILNFLLAVLSVGAPVWFAWLSTKQIGQRFRLAEDYAFKASISRAYDGFRREAARFDKDMEARLLSSALDRLDELPLRLVEADNHGSPWHELANSEVVKQAMRVVPNFAEQVKDMASKAVSVVATVADKKQSSSGASSQSDAQGTQG